MIVADSVALIAAIAGVVSAVGAIAALWGIFRRFRLKLRARIDARRQAIRVDLENNGRASGWVNRVVATNAELVELETTFAGLEDGRFRPAELPGHSSWRLVIGAARSDGRFPPDARVRVDWGRGKTRTLVPEAADVGYYGMESSWPPP